ncbi:EAL domain-containing protein [Roseibium aggregatum]|uniref:EAL domain-containing protein n=1 Tax=Roseibium aggregatum TaxID=187304 RepID=UPI001AD8ED86|nr:EAL domain-containing protein [Roseibium aggregatum]
MIPQPAAFLNTDGAVVAVNRAFGDLLGLGTGDPIGTRFSDCLSRETRRRCRPALKAAFNGTPAEISGKLVSASGADLGSRAVCTPIPLQEEASAVVLLQFDGVAEEPESLGIDDLLTRFPDDVLIFGALEEPASILAPLEDAAGGSIDLAELEVMLENCLNGDVQTLYAGLSARKAHCEPGSAAKITEIRLVPLAEPSDRDRPGVMAIVRSNVDSPHEVEEYRRLAYQDALTGLSNRRAFLTFLQEHLARLEENPLGGLAVFYFDLDEFKKVNDLGGHDAGDEMLVRVAFALQRCFCDTGCVGRIGGDEFAGMCLLPDEGHALDHAERVLDALSRIRLEVSNRIFTIGSSIGISFLTSQVADKPIDPSALLRLADAACLRGKRVGGRTVHLHKADADDFRLDDAVPAQVLEPDDIRANDFALYSMPIRFLQEDRPCGEEILLRLRGEQASGYSPKVLISAAERSGFVAQIEGWTLDKVLDAAAARDGKTVLTVNVSAESAGNPDFRDLLQKRLCNDPLMASRICLEVAERDFLREPTTIESFFQFLIDLGCQTAIDDFAGHWPVLARLTDLRVDWIKLDSSLTQLVTRDRSKALVLKGLTDAAHDLGIKVIAKHVETEREMALLRALGIEAAQGYFFGKPAPWA